ncbi:phosphoribosylanthranilate isomerase [Roseisolibacter sp. H3M3-2]|uniref:phosphoribosylanthranilate isomerase n=1 Tax=Roseisolibacter sp. H3M3-2 TaxID=3031323 RepID=UPI0023DA4132|nr:phosphoribosylanthranilate isomerase [Roseisolibacter sp. H3M3-2]MDF1501532.1 phosphoribosylanthranilate isomerase [Roseisolibacter sp. H3M3-2]
MSAPAVKICGLVRAEDAAEAARLGADYLGAIFAGGPRQIVPAAARAILEAARDAASGPRPLGVGVMGTQAPDAIARIADEAGLDVVQLHADPDAAAVEAVRRVYPGRVWAVLRIAGADVPPQAADLFAAADAVVLDAKVDGHQLGGTGVALAWGDVADALAPLRGRTPLVLAGGLRAENLGDAVRALLPDVVDVSSGVERSPGVKDPQRLAAFLAAARSATSS